MKRLYFILLSVLSISLFISSCSNTPKSSKINQNNPIEVFSGWWIYGEGQHIYKDSKSLKEFDLIFPNEDSLYIIDLYLSVTEMNYLSIETNFYAFVNDDSLLQVDDFEITYIQGCDEQ